MGFDFNEWVGKRIQECRLKDNGDMMWKVDDTWYNLIAIGDCCSSSWFEHCEGGDVLQDAILLEYDGDAEGESDAEDDDDDHVITVNFLRFKTTKGYCTIEFRNSSNGYYSGWCEVDESDMPPKDSYKLLGSF